VGRVSEASPADATPRRTGVSCLVRGFVGDLVASMFVAPAAVAPADCNPGFTTGYDGLSRRVAIAADGGAAIRFGWCGSSLCQQRSGADVPTRRYLAEGEAGLTDTTRLYYSVDQLGSVRDALDATSGRSAAHFDYDWYGERLGARTPSATDFRFAGLFLHQPSGLDLSATRAYDPATGTWLSRDPIGEAGGINLYTYVRHNPVRRIHNITRLIEWHRFMSPNETR